MENHAVLENFHYGSAFVACGGSQYVLRCGKFHVDRTGEEVAAGTEYKLSGYEGVFHCAVGA